MTRPLAAVLVGGVAALLIAAACSASLRDRKRTRVELTDSVLGGLTYPTPELRRERVALHDGEWVGDSGLVGRETVFITLSARGDISGDGHADAVILLLTDPGATGKFFDIVPVLSTADGGPRVGRATAVGDRVRPESLWVSNGIVTLRLVTHDSTDGACCPSRRAEQRYRLTRDSLVLDTRP